MIDYYKVTVGWGWTEKPLLLQGFRIHSTLEKDYLDLVVWFHRWSVYQA